MAIWPGERTGTTILLDGETYLVADATTAEQHSQDAAVTMHPRETGGDVSDHYQAKLPEVALTLVFTNTPLTFDNDDADRPSNAYRSLLDLQEQRLLVTLLTRVAIYEDCALVSCGAPVSVEDGQALSISTTWRVLRRVSTEQTTIPAEILRGLVRATGKGKDSTKDQVSEPTIETQAADLAADAVRGKTIMRGIIDAATGG